MVPRRRRPLVDAVALAFAAALVVLLLAVVRHDAPSSTVVRQDAPSSAVPSAPPATDSSTAPVAQPAGAEAVAPGDSSLVAVTVANVWKEPGLTRPLDEPSLTNPVDMGRWTAAMSHEDKLWLVDRLVTQALYGERVAVQEIRDTWARVVVTGQPSSLHPDGYPGWVPTVQLRAGDPPATGRSAVVTRPTAPLRDPADPSRELLGLSYNTRLPVVEERATEVTVALPTGGRGLLAADDVEVDVGAGVPGPRTAADVVRSARLLAGIPYLWAGTSTAGFDCSGLTAAVYGAHGIVIPRDAEDQAGSGSPVEQPGFEPGDLLFYSAGPDRRSIHHVSMYVGNGMMIQAPATGKSVEIVPVDTPQYARQYWGARRYLPSG